MLITKWRIIHFVTSLEILYVVKCFIHDNDRKTATACAGRCSYQYSLQCPFSQKIALHHLEYVSKDVSYTCPAFGPSDGEPCQDKEECCSYNPADCRIPFSHAVAFPFYSKCSGKQYCQDSKPASISTAIRCYNRDFSNYVAASYSCIDDNTFVDICSNSTVYGTAVNLILNGTQPTHIPGFANSHLCACVISTSDCDSSARLQFQAVDVRLHQNQNITQCHPHSSFDITDGEYNSRPRYFKCQEDHFYRDFIDLYYSRKPYARISLYNKPELNISQLWLHIKATLPNVGVFVTCGSGAIHHASYNVCVPPDFYPTTTIVNTQQTTYNPRPEEDKYPGQGNDLNAGNVGEKTDFIPIIAGAVVAVVILTVLIILLVCCRRKRRMKKEQEDRFTHGMTAMAPPLPSPGENDYDEYDRYAGHYYDSVGSPNGSGGTFTPSPFVQPVTPGKNMGSFFPTEPKKVPPPIVPVLPPIVPSNPPPEGLRTYKPPQELNISKKPPQERQGSDDKDANPYQQPWDGKPLPAPNRLKKSDLAYATSEEIQVLIQRMDNERRRLNEGEMCTSPSGFIHIDDYELSQARKDKDTSFRGEEDEEEAVDEDDNQNIIDIRHSSHIPEDRHLPEHVHLDPNDVMCSSEDTGYRSVGSQEHILVSEDDYLVPKTRKEDASLPQRPSSQSDGKVEKSSNRSSASEDKSSTNGEMVAKEQYADVYDALEDGNTVDVKTKF